jgi:hypothetical protein
MGLADEAAKCAEFILLSSFTESSTYRVAVDVLEGMSKVPRAGDE